MRPAEFVRRWFRAEPRTPKEREVFHVMTVSHEGAQLFLAGGEVLLLRDAAACAVLEELASSARRRLLELEIDAMRGAHGHEAAAAPVGAARTGGTALRDPLRVLPAPPAGRLLANAPDTGTGAGVQHG